MALGNTAEADGMPAEMPSSGNAEATAMRDEIVDCVGLAIALYGDTMAMRDEVAAMHAEIVAFRNALALCIAPPTHRVN